MRQVTKSILFSILAVCIPMQGFAEVPVIDPGSISSSISNAGSIVSAIIEQKLQDMANLETLVRNNKDNNNKVVSAVSVQTNVQAETARTIAENQEQAEIARAKQKETADAVIAAQPPPSGGCTGRLAGQGLNNSGAGSKKVEGEKSKRRSYRYRSAPSRSKQLMETLATHKEKYCGQGEPGCEKVADPGFENADVQAKTLFSGAAGEKAPAGEKLTFDEKETEAAEDFIKNVTEAGDTPRKLTKAEAGTEEGKHYESLRVIYESRTSLAESGLLRILSRRVGTDESEKAYEALMRDETEKGLFFQKYINRALVKIGSAYRSVTGNRISELDLLKFEVDRRFANPDWHSSVQKGTTESLLKELVLMQALQLKFEYEKLRDREQMMATASLQALDSTKEKLLPLLKQAEQRAVAAAK